MKKKIIILLVLIGILVALLFVASKIYHFLLSFQGPDHFESIRFKLRELPSKDLINKADNIFYEIFSLQSSLALDVLVERKEREAIPLFLKLLRSRNNEKRKIAFWALASINDPTTVASLMEIVQKGEDHQDYIDALITLSQMRYEGALPYVIKLAEKFDADVNGSIGMIKDIGNPELIPVLKDIKARINPRDTFAKLSNSLIDEAIAYLESIQKQQEEQIFQELPPA
ncbi:MAG: HEAT repeat domain-containing protein [Candidatus Omnitrophica bacterium]|nr:HEAT repeat domain-containing protein [Candidatus Omnitrophota bacterium]